MTWFREMVDLGNLPPPALMKNFIMTAGPLSYAIVRNPATVAKNIPAWRMRLNRGRMPWVHIDDESTFDSTKLLTMQELQEFNGPIGARGKKYLRPTRMCDHTAPEIQAFARRLGADDKDSLAYAQSIFYFVKNEKELQMKPMKGAMGVLKSKGGVCLDQMTLLIALARAGSIPSRYRLYAFTASQELENLLLNDNPILKETYEILGFLDSLHGCAELYIDGEWMQLDPTFSDALEAGMGLPVSSFGDEPTWRTRLPERDIIFEGFPIFFKNLLVGMALLLRDTVDRVNDKMDELSAQGREILDEMGKEAYNKSKLKQQVKINVPTIEEIMDFRRQQTVQKINS